MSCGNRSRERIVQSDGVDLLNIVEGWALLEGRTGVRLDCGWLR